MVKTVLLDKTRTTLQNGKDRLDRYFLSSGELNAVLWSVALYSLLVWISNQTSTSTILVFTYAMAISITCFIVLVFWILCFSHEPSTLLWILTWMWGQFTILTLSNLITEGLYYLTELGTALNVIVTFSFAIGISIITILLYYFSTIRLHHHIVQTHLQQHQTITYEDAIELVKNLQQQLDQNNKVITLLYYPIGTKEIPFV